MQDKDVIQVHCVDFENQVNHLLDTLIWFFFVFKDHENKRFLCGLSDVSAKKEPLSTRCLSFQFHSLAECRLLSLLGLSARHTMLMHCPVLLFWK